MAGSPYLIVEDIKILNGSDLIIEPGVEVLFEGHFYIDVKGSIHANGNSIDRITFKNDIDNKSWNGIRFDNSDGTMYAPSKLQYCDIYGSVKTGTNCSSPDPESSGGAIYVESFSDLEITKCEIFNNSVLAHGGAIGIFESSSPLIRNNSIHNNYAKKRGGGIAIFRGSNPDIIDNNIYRNEAKKGGGGIAIGILNNINSPCSPNVQDNIISENTVSGLHTSSGYWYGDGGGVFICGSNPSLSNNTLDLNNADKRGGAIYIKQNSNVTIENNSINNNYANIEGGGIYISSSSIVTINTCQFTNNSAVNGGGINVNNGELYANSCTFSKNTASTDGGGIYVLNSTSTIEKCSFEENTATGNGGAVFMNDPEHNSIKLNIFKTNTAYQGSALYYFRYNSNSPNYNNQTEVLNNLFAENNATDKGVVYMQGNNKYTVFNHNTVSNNTCTAPAFISGVCIEDNDYKPLVDATHKNFHNNIIYESIVDILIIAGQYAYQHPSNYLTLAGINYLNTNTSNNSNPAPGFVSSTDYHLTSTSPCVDPTGSVNTATMTNNDLDGNNRIHNSKTDYGCYEFGSSPPARKGRTISTNEDNQISVYPNPANSFINIEVGNGIIMSIDIFDISGQRVYSSGSLFSENNFTIPVDNLKPGYYLLSIQTPNQKINRKVVIK